MSLDTPDLTSMIYIALHTALDLALQDFRAHVLEKALVPHHTWMWITHNNLQNKGEGLVHLQTNQEVRKQNRPKSGC